MGNKRQFNQIASTATLLFLILSIVFFLRSQLASLFLGSHPIEMSFRRAIVIDSENANFFFEMGLLRERLADDVSNDIRKRQRYMDALSAMEAAIRKNPYQLAYRISYSDLALKAGIAELGEKIFDFGTSPYDFEYYLAHAFYEFRRAELTPDESERKRLIQNGIQLYQKARLATDFAKPVALHKLKTFSSLLQSELTPILSTS